jgi:thiosulfate/3-mercaptopyruvate sulfurtransferase
MATARERALLTPAQLESQLQDERLRLFDTTVVMARKADGSFAISSGRDDYHRGHIPGAGFLDLLRDFSDTQSDLPFMLPSESQFAAAASAAGIGPDCRVVLYNAGPVWWSTRFWFMFREFGFHAVQVLDGGLDRWRAEGRPLATGAVVYPPARFAIRERGRFFVGKDTVARAAMHGDATLVNALSAEQHAGRVTQFARAGHITGSRHLFALDLLDESQSFQPESELARRLQAAQLLDGRPVIAYCGGGIAATANAFALWLVGQEQVEIYDGSLAEWTRDPSAPMSTI